MESGRRGDGCVNRQMGRGREGVRKRETQTPFCLSPLYTFTHTHSPHIPFHLHGAIMGTNGRVCPMVQEQPGHAVVSVGARLVERGPAGIVLHVGTDTLNLQEVLCHGLQTSEQRRARELATYVLVS